MTREEASELIRQIRDSERVTALGEKTALYTNEAKEALDMAITALEKQEQDRWIPVTERLPESKEEDLEYPTVLVCFADESVTMACFCESTKEWGCGDEYDRVCHPIAWMPLPEPYREEGTE